MTPQDEKARWLAQRRVWHHQPDRDQRWACHGCGVQAAEPRLGHTKRGVPFYILKCRSCTSWSMARRVGVRFLAGISEAYRQRNDEEVFASLVRGVEEGMRLFEGLEWVDWAPPSGKVQQVAMGIPCMFCSGMRAHLRHDRTGRPYATCGGCDSRTFYAKDSPSLLSGLGLGVLAIEYPEAWMRLTDLGEVHLERLHGARAPEA